MIKQLIIFTFLVSALFANPLQSVDASFSQAVQTQLLEKLSSEHFSTLHKKNTYTLTKGWNQLTTPKDGVDVIKTFKNISEVKFVVTYDSKSKYWAGFTLDSTVLSDIKEMLLLKYLEPNVTFFALSSKDIHFNIESNQVNTICQQLMQTKGYGVLKDSGMSKDVALSDDKSINLQSRYRSHEFRGFYADTRVVLIYPKIKNPSKITQKYAPAEPTVAVQYAKEYENKKFFIYDYLEQNCYGGVFPSRKMPPLPVLRVLK